MGVHLGYPESEAAQYHARDVALPRTRLVAENVDQPGTSFE